MNVSLLHDSTSRLSAQDILAKSLKERSLLSAKGTLKYTAIVFALSVWPGEGLFEVVTTNFKGASADCLNNSANIYSPA
jgi:hypothetical protein